MCLLPNIHYSLKLNQFLVKNEAQYVNYYFYHSVTFFLLLSIRYSFYNQSGQNIDAVFNVWTVLNLKCEWKTSNQSDRLVELQVNILIF